MAEKWKYRSVSLKNSTYSKITNLTSRLVPGVELSSAKVIDKLVEDSHSNFRRDINNGITNYAKNKEYQKA